MRLRGMSLFWSQWQGHYWNQDVLDWLLTDWHISFVRAAMGVEMDGYVEHPSTERTKLETVVDASIRLGLYVVIDWHSYVADNYTDEGKAFFDQVAQKYGKQPNVLFELWNEPTDVSWTSVVKPYHEALVPIIRRHSENIVICGTPTWSQRVDEASLSPVHGHNIAYTLHFYAAFEPHQEPLREMARAALRNGIAIVATEWGTCMNTGNGTLNLTEAERWIAFLGENDIWDANWAISDKDESCSALQAGASPAGGWSLEDLTPSGSFVRQSILSMPGDWARTPPPEEKQGGSNLPVTVGAGLTVAIAACVSVAAIRWAVQDKPSYTTVAMAQTDHLPQQRH